MPDSGIGHAVDILRLPEADRKETPAATSQPARNTQPPAGTFYRDGAEKRPAETFGRRRKGTGTDAQRNGNTDRTLPYPAEKHAGKLACIQETAPAGKAEEAAKHPDAH